MPGALFRCLSAFALRDISCTKIESRPLRGRPWEYWFYLDFLGRADDPVSQKALGHLAELADFLRVLGHISRKPYSYTNPSVYELQTRPFWPRSKQRIFGEIARQLVQNSKAQRRLLLAKVHDRQ